jgi:hypothetical protein
MENIQTESIKSVNGSEENLVKHIWVVHGSKGNTVKFFFSHWQSIVRKTKWLELWYEEQEEIEYAEKNNMDSIYWCKHCIYGCCDRH